MKYETELPEKFNTWVELYDVIKASGLEKEHEDILFFNIEDEILIENNSLPAARKENRYEIKYIKDKAFQELLAERMDKKEFQIWYKGVNEILRVDGHGEKSPLIIGLRKIQRIVTALNGQK